MKRCFIHVNEVVDFVLECLLISKKGKIFIPKTKSYKIKDIAKKISPKHKTIRVRLGEKSKNYF